MKPPVRLRAADARDLAVISALLQDALVPLADMAYLKDERYFVLAVNRYRWDDPEEPSRTHALVGFRQVDRVQSRSLRRTDPTRILNLLTVTYADGVVQAEFAESGSLRLHVSELECLLEDVGEPWPAVAQPRHETE